MTTPFIGREAEMARLQGLLSKASASLIVVRGRRRIGKSRLLAEFGKGMESFFFSGNPPAPKTTATYQRKVFVEQLERAGIPGVQPSSWGTLFWHLAQHTKKGAIFIVLDEISWMGGKDPRFLGELKTAWDLYFSQNPELIIALCGSVSSWIEKNILSSTGFLGRITLDLVLDELPLHTCSEFWRSKADRVSAYEKFKVLAVTGGVPLYLEQMRPELPAEQTIRDLCFTKGGLLVREFDDIFSDLFSRKSSAYKDIVTCLASGPKELSRICQELGKGRGGFYSTHVDTLVKAGFVTRDFIWDLKSGKTGKISRYRLSDNYVRFYLKYIAPNRAKIERGIVPSDLPGWDSIMGLQFENLVLHNSHAIWQRLGLSMGEIVMEGPFFQTPTKRQQGCQVDYMIQTRFSTLYICEIKFSKRPVGQEVIEAMEAKGKRLKVPKHFSIRPVLIHVNGVEEDVAAYFDKVIDFGKLLATPAT